MQRMHAHIITGGSQENREQWIKTKLREWSVPEIDRITIQPGDSSTGIAQIRELIRQVSLSPATGNVTVGLLYSAEKITSEAQHAFLKTLEEPPPRARFILETANTDFLIPTIISRCEVVRLAPSEIVRQNDMLLEVLRIWKLEKGARLRETESLVKTKAEALEFTESVLASVHTRLSGTHADSSLISAAKLSAIARAAMRTQKYLRANVSPRLALDAFFLKLPEENTA